MPLVDPKHPLFQLLQRDRRYTLDAYLFVLEALNFAQEALGLGQEPTVEELESPHAAVGRPGESAEPPRTRAERGRKRRAERHVSGQQLCEAARLYGLQQYGYLAPTVLASWGIRSTDDVGEIVFNMIDIGQMRKTRADKREDFRGVYDFAEAFTRDLSFVVPDLA
jgi:uncharacterized repeat protein (TIGR04138 family)